MRLWASAPSHAAKDFSSSKMHSKPMHMDVARALSRRPFPCSRPPGRPCPSRALSEVGPAPVSRRTGPGARLKRDRSRWHPLQAERKADTVGMVHDIDGSAHFGHINLGHEQALSTVAVSP